MKSSVMSNKVQKGFIVRKRFNKLYRDASFFPEKSNFNFLVSVITILVIL
jgi:hypothetical protein